MADNLGYTPGSGATVASDDVGGFHHQRVKPTWGADGTANDVDAAAGKCLPTVEVYNGAAQVTKLSITTTAGEILASALSNRRCVVLYADPANTAAVHWRFSSAPTSSNAQPLYPGAVKVLKIGPAIHLYAIAASGTQTVWAEEYS